MKKARGIRHEALASRPSAAAGTRQQKAEDGTPYFVPIAYCLMPILIRLILASIEGCVEKYSFAALALPADD